jgi:hypothetical protein
MRQHLSRRELEDLHAVLRRAAERAERNKEFEHAEKLSREVAELTVELARAE